MKKILIELLQKYFDDIINEWTKKIRGLVKNSTSEENIYQTIKNALRTIISVIDDGNYERADQFLINLRSQSLLVNLNLFDVSEFLSNGRFAILKFLDDKNNQYDTVILLGFLDSVLEQIFARYSMFFVDIRLEELAKDRDRIAKRLQVNQQYLQTLLYGSESAIMVVNEKEKFVAWNNGAEKIFGYSEFEIVGKNSSFLLPDEESYIEELRNIKRFVQQNGHYKLTETKRKTKTGKIIPVTLTVTKLTGMNGKYGGRSVIINDVTEVKTLQRQVDQSEKLAVIGQLAAGVAHEIGNPLTSISSVVQLLQRKTKETFMANQLATIKENIDRISKIVRELVDFSKPPGYDKTNTNVTNVIKTAIGIVRYDKRVKNVEFKPNLTKDLPEVNIVSDQLLQVFVNILLNALDAINGNGIISVKSYKDEKNIYVRIKDDGCGMNKEIINKIFDPFFTTKDVGKGTGLGLSVSYGIISKFGGDIKVESELNSYSLFTISIPIENGDK